MLTRLLFLLVPLSLGYSQAVQPEKPQGRTIEVRGSAETSVTPNEFTFNLLIRERYDKKEKITLEDQERRLKEALAKIGVDVPKELTILSLGSYFGRVGRKQKDELAARSYRLKVNDLAKIDMLQEMADELDLAEFRLVESSHTDLVNLRKQTKSEAVRAAKAKAAYMLEAIGETLGKPVLIEELPEVRELNELPVNIRNSSNLFSVGNVASPASTAIPTPMEISQIKLRYEVRANFEIQ